MEVVSNVQAQGGDWRQTFTNFFISFFFFFGNQLEPNEGTEIDQQQRMLAGWTIGKKKKKLRVMLYCCSANRVCRM